MHIINFTRLCPVMLVWSACENVHGSCSVHKCSGCFTDLINNCLCQPPNFCLSADYEMVFHFVVLIWISLKLIRLSIFSFVYRQFKFLLYLFKTFVHFYTRLFTFFILVCMYFCVLFWILIYFWLYAKYLLSFRGLHFHIL